MYFSVPVLTHPSCFFPGISLIVLGCASDGPCVVIGLIGWPLPTKRGIPSHYTLDLFGPLTSHTSTGKYVNIYQDGQQFTFVVGMKTKTYTFSFILFYLFQIYIVSYKHAITRVVHSYLFCSCYSSIHLYVFQIY